MRRASEGNQVQGAGRQLEGPGGIRGPGCRIQPWFVLAFLGAEWLLETPPSPFHKPLAALASSHFVLTTCK